MPQTQGQWQRLTRVRLRKLAKVFPGPCAELTVCTGNVDSWIFIPGFLQPETASQQILSIVIS